MKVFKKEYALVYDYLYQDKDYEKECDFIEAIFNKFSRKIESILDLGCGTGAHAFVLAKRGYKVLGVDRSSEMLTIARKKAKNAGLKIDFYEASIQDFNFGENFDAVIAMFAVMSYQTSNEDLSSACMTAKKHLSSDGIFVFDAWNGLAVLTDPPTQRIKEVNNGDERIIRITNPCLDMLSHSVEVNFKVLVLRKEKLLYETEETHKMRFFFPQEIKYFLKIAGFSDIQFCPFLKPEDPLTEKDWNMTVIAR